jgi:flagellin-like hook-associated protein FlgL
MHALHEPRKEYAMSNIVLTAALRSNLLSLQGTASLLSQTQLRLSTGLKVNSALDNPSAFFQSQALTNRSSDLSSLLDSIGQSVQVLKAADTGITSLTTLVKQAQSIAQSAQSSLTNSAFVRSGDISVAQQADLTGAGVPKFAAADAVVVNVGGANTTVTIAANETLAQLASALNAITGVSATIVDGSAGSPAGTKRLEIHSTDGTALTLTNSVGTFVAKLAAGHGGAAGALGGAIGTQSSAAGTGAVALATGVAAAVTSNTVNQISLEKQYSTVRANIDSLISDAGYQGTNLLNGDTLNVQFNEKNTSKLSVVGVTFNSAGLGISQTIQSTVATTSGSFLNAANISSSLTEITNALGALRSQSQTFGNNLNIVQARQDFTTNLINTLKAGSDALVLADKNEEGASLLSLQTSQQLGIQALSLASQANQSVLRLFG